MTERKRLVGNPHRRHASDRFQREQSFDPKLTDNGCFKLRGFEPTQVGKS